MSVSNPPWHYLTSGPRHGVLRRLIEQGVEIAGVYVTNPEKWPKVVDSIAIAEANKITWRVLKRADLVALPPELARARCLSVGFGFLLPRQFLDHVSVCLNVHGTLLPDFPGARSLNWVVECGETESGVTVHIVDDGVDTGPIVLQKRFPVSRFDTVASLARKTLAFEPEVVLEALERFQVHGLAGAVAQSTSGAKRFPDRVPAHSQIDPRRPLLDLYDEIRAADPVRFPAFFIVDGQRVCVRLWRPDKPPSDADMI